MVGKAEAVEFDFGGVKTGGVGPVKGDDQLVALHVEAGDNVGFIVGIGGHADAAALTCGVAVKAAVLPEDFALAVYDIAGFVLDVVFEEAADIHVAEKANALAVFFSRVGQFVLLGDGANFGLLEFADGEECAGDLFLAKECEEIGLVFIGVTAFEQVAAAVGIIQFADVVTCGDGIEAVVEGVALEDAELHLAVAHDVGVWRDAFLVALDEVVDNLFAVFVDEVDDLVVDPEMGGYLAGILDVLLCRAVGQRHFLVHPGAYVCA